MKSLKLAIILLVGLFIVPNIVKAQSTNDKVTLVVSANGATKEEATQNALLSAIEQTYGTFVSVNTSIIDDNLVKDEIATVSSGNIQKYKEVSCENLPSGNVFVTLEAIVSIDNLANYARNKGAEVEFAGNAFAMNFKIWEFNKRNEEKAISNLFNEMYELYKKGFDYSLNVGKPMSSGIFKCTVDAKLNNNGNVAESLFYSTLEAISLEKNEISEYKDVHIETYSVYVTSGKRTFVLRSQNSIDMIKRFFNLTYPKALYNFTIDTGISKSSIDLVHFEVTYSSVEGEPNSSMKYDDGNMNTGTPLFGKTTECSYYGKPFGLYMMYNADSRKLNQILSWKDLMSKITIEVDNQDIPFAIKKRDIADAAIDAYPQKKHKIEFYIQVPMDELMKISKITITSNN